MTVIWGFGDDGGHDDADDDGYYLLSDYSLAGSRLSPFPTLMRLILLTASAISPSLK